MYLVLVPSILVLKVFILKFITLFAQSTVDTVINIYCLLVTLTVITYNKWQGGLKPTCEEKSQDFCSTTATPEAIKQLQFYGNVSGKYPTTKDTQPKGHVPKLTAVTCPSGNDPSQPPYDTSGSLFHWVSFTDDINQELVSSTR